MIQDKLNPTVYADERNVVQHFNKSVDLENILIISSEDRDLFEKCIGEYAKHYPDIAKLIMKKANVHMTDKMTPERCRRFSDACASLWSDYNFAFKYRDIKESLLLVQKHTDDFKGWTFNKLFAKYPYFHDIEIYDTFDYSDVNIFSLVTSDNIDKVVKGCNKLIDFWYNDFEKDFKLNRRKKNKTEH